MSTMDDGDFPVHIPFFLLSKPSSIAKSLLLKNIRRYPGKYKIRRISVQKQTNTTKQSLLAI